MGAADGSLGLPRFYEASLFLRTTAFGPKAYYLGSSLPDSVSLCDLNQAKKSSNRLLVCFHTAGVHFRSFGTGRKSLLNCGYLIDVTYKDTRKDGKFAVPRDLSRSQLPQHSEQPSTHHLPSHGRTNEPTSRFTCRIKFWPQFYGAVDTK